MQPEQISPQEDQKIDTSETQSLIEPENAIGTELEASLAEADKQNVANISASPDAIQQTTNSGQTPSIINAEIAAANAHHFEPEESPLNPGMIIGDSSQPQQVINPSDVNSKTGKKKRNTLLVAIVAFTVLLLIGGGSAYAYFGYLVPNKPNNVMKQAVANAFTPESLKSFGASLTMTPKKEGESPTTIAVTAGTNNTVGRADFNIEFSAIKLSGSVLVDNQGDNLYVKINELPSLLGLIGLPGNALQSKISNKWLKFNTETARQTVDVKNEGITSDACLSELSKIVSSETFRNQLATVYDTNQFANAAKVGSDTINGVRSAKYNVTINTKTVDSFVTATSDYLQNKLTMANAKCTNGNLKQSAANSISSLATDTKLSTAYIWVDSNKQLQKIQINLTSPDQDIKLELLLNQTQKVDLTVPTDATNINDIQKELTSYLNFL